MEGLQDEPDYEFYLETSSSIWIIIYTLCTTCVLSLCIVAYTAMKYQMAEWVLYPSAAQWWTWTLLAVSFTLWCSILFFITTGDLKLLSPNSRARDLLHKCVNSVLILYFLFQLLVFGIGLPKLEDGSPLASNSPFSWLFLHGPIYGYIVLTVVRVRTFLSFVSILGISTVVLIMLIFASQLKIP